MLSNKMYNFMKKMVQIGIPATSSLYFGLAQIWGLPYAEQIVGSLALIATFLGVVLGLSTMAYNNSDDKYDGTAVVEINQETGSKVVSLVLNSDPYLIDEKKDIFFKVQPESTIQ